jgi:hypothetical protein
MAAYLSSIGSDARAVQQRKPPSLGAGASGPTETATARPPQPVPGAGGADQASPPESPLENQAALPPGSPGRREKPAGERPAGEKPVAAAEKPAPAAAAAIRPRRPSESMETGKLTAASPLGGGAEGPAQAVAAPALRPGSAEEFEE